MQWGIPWFDPADGLRTVCGLIRLIEAGVPHDLRVELRDARVRRLIESGIDPELAEEVQHRSDPSFPLTSCLWNLRTFELELAYADRTRDRFNFYITY
jgi:hypothetical protein